MITKEHEAPLDLLQQNVSLLPPVLKAHGFELPSEFDECEPVTERFTELGPHELNADGCFVLRHDKQPRLVVIYEVQRGRDEDKPRSWPRYVAGAWARYGVPVALLVHCPDPSLIGWCAKPIVMGKGCVITPTVLSERSMPLILNADEWQGGIELAVAAAFVHANGPHGEAVIDAVCELLSTIDPEQAKQYTEGLLYTLPEPAISILEAAVLAGTYPYQSGLERLTARAESRGEARGEARGKVKGTVAGETRALLLVLDARGVDVSEEARERISACRDTDQLELWLTRAATVSSAEELFD